MDRQVGRCFFDLVTEAVCNCFFRVMPPGLRVSYGGEIFVTL